MNLSRSGCERWPAKWAATARAAQFGAYGLVRPGGTELIEPRFHLSKALRLLRSHVVPFPQILGQVIKLRLRSIAEFRIRVPVHPRTVARFDEFPIALDERQRSGVLNHIVPALFRLPQQRTVFVKAVRRRFGSQFRAGKRRGGCV